MARECEFDRAGTRLTRDERKALRIADLRECTAERRIALREKCLADIAFNAECHATQLRNGMAVTQAQLARNNASAVLTLECLDAIA